MQQRVVFRVHGDGLGDAAPAPPCAMSVDAPRTTTKAPAASRESLLIILMYRLPESPMQAILQVAAVSQQTCTASNRFPESMNAAVTRRGARDALLVARTLRFEPGSR